MTQATQATMPPSTASSSTSQRHGLDYALRLVPFAGFHVATLAMVVVAGLPTWQALLACFVGYYLRMFAITAGYHRYFSHRSYKTSRAFQLLLGTLGAACLQKGPLWWAAHHRHHHRDSDTERDIHSPTRRGFWWAHVGWVLSPRYEATRWETIRDFARYPELRFLNHYLVGPALFALACLAVLLTLGFQALVWGCFVSTVLLWHGTFTINSLSHLVGKRVYATTDTSKNSLLLALLTMGEGWHNNHHYYQVSAAQGFRWYEVDVSYRILWCLQKVGLVWDLRTAPAEVVAGKLGGRDWLIRAPERVQRLPEPAPAAAAEAA